ncbi:MULTISPECIES: hypothetical protein [Clostridium]|uniref:hypothetical protein n=1 Tax=Clostridium TaxID=1485 RepID=UPI000826996D|nr:MULTISPECIES: hypothetical protein [Clostridium]PJI07820.1 hypothetical protein CUB90_08075 [Clostridium sp. CT7]
MSKLTNCKACGKEMTKRSICPNCGKDQRIFFVRHKILTVLAVLIIALIGFVTNAYVAGQATVLVLIIMCIIGSVVDKVQSKKVAR